MMQSHFQGPLLGSFEYVPYTALTIVCIKLNKMLAQIDKYFDIKNGLQGKPELYLGAKLKEVHLDDGTICWGMSSAKYVHEALKNTKM